MRSAVLMFLSWVALLSIVLHGWGVIQFGGTNFKAEPPKPPWIDYGHQ